MRQVFFATLATLALVASAHAATEAAGPRTLDTTWKVSLDAQGHVVDLAQSTKVKPVLSEPLARAIRGWDFEPGRVDGQPAPTETTLYVTVRLEPQANDGYAVRVERVRTGGGIKKMAAPKFPMEAVRRHGDSFSAMVVVETHYDAVGKVISAGIAPDSPTAERAISNAALQSVRRWTFQPERVDGHGIASTAYVPICFALGNAPLPYCGTWKPPGAAGTDIGNGEAFALNPAATLKSDVIGRML